MTDKTWAHVVDGVVTETIPLDAEIVPGRDVYLPEFADWLVDVTDVKPQPLPGWTYDGKAFAPPAPAAPAAAPNVPDLARIVVSAASSACDAVTQQVVPDATHQQAYQNAATIVWGNGGKAPTSGAAATVIAAQAQALGLSVDTFAALVTTVSLASLQLATLLSTLRGAADAATSADKLKDALAAFETGLAGLVDSLNGAGLTVTVAAPAPITVVGVNA